MGAFMAIFKPSWRQSAKAERSPRPSYLSPPCPLSAPGVPPPRSKAHRRSTRGPGPRSRGGHHHSPRPAETARRLPVPRCDLTPRHCRTLAVSPRSRPPARYSVPAVQRFLPAAAPSAFIPPCPPAQFARLLFELRRGVAIHSIQQLYTSNCSFSF